MENNSETPKFQTPAEVELCRLLAVIIERGVTDGEGGDGGDIAAP